MSRCLQVEILKEGYPPQEVMNPLLPRTPDEEAGSGYVVVEIPRR